MGPKYLDVVVAKQNEFIANGQTEQRTIWNRIGRAWLSKSGGSLNFELFLFPNHRYVINFGSRNDEQPSQPQNEAAKL